MKLHISATTLGVSEGNTCSGKSPEIIMQERIAIPGLNVLVDVNTNSTHASTIHSVIL